MEEERLEKMNRDDRLLSPSRETTLSLSCTTEEAKKEHLCSFSRTLSRVTTVVTGPFLPLVSQRVEKGEERAQRRGHSISISHVFFYLY